MKRCPLAQRFANFSTLAGVPSIDGIHNFDDLAFAFIREIHGSAGSQSNCLNHRRALNFSRGAERQARASKEGRQLNRASR